MEYINSLFVKWLGTKICFENTYFFLHFYKIIIIDTICLGKLGMRLILSSSISKRYPRFAITRDLRCLRRRSVPARSREFVSSDDKRMDARVSD